MGYIFLLLLFGGIAGCINGLIGCGGGIVIVYALSYFYKKSDTVENRDIFAAAVVSVLPMTLVSSVNYFRNGAELLPDMKIYILPAVCGGIVGAYFLGKISSGWLKRIFSLLVIWAGISLILKETGVL